jgi:hypothetical protein
VNFRQNILKTKNFQLSVIGVGYNMSGELKKVFVDEKSFKEFSEKIKIK